MSDLLAPSEPAAPYRDDVDWLTGELALLALTVRLRLAERERLGLLRRDPVLALAEPPADPDALTAALTAARASHAGRLAASGPFAPALARLAAEFALDRLDTDILLLALAPSLDGAFLGLFGRARGSAYRAPLDVEVALTLLCDDLGARVAARARFTPQGPLLRHGLLTVSRSSPTDGTDPFLAMALRLPPRVASHILGETTPDPTLEGLASLLEPTEDLDRVVLPTPDRTRLLALLSRHEAFTRTLADWGLTEVVRYGRGVTLLFAGPPGTGKTLTARALARHLGLRLLRVDVARLAAATRDFSEVVDNLLREARLMRALLFFDECEALFGQHNRLGGRLPVLLTALEGFDGLCVLATNLPEVLDPALDRRVLYRVNFEQPTVRMREAIWELHLPPALPRATDVDVGYLARRFEFAGGFIKNAALLAASAAADRAATGAEAAEVRQADLVAASHAQLRHRLGDLADRDAADLRLDDLVLPPDVKRQVIEIIDAVSAQSVVFREWGFGKKFNKGRGLSALFDGEPGTGKTLSAEVIAAELGLALLRVNVANIVSKYVGETEKNLTRVFTEARGTQSVLLFDEADSLFAKRVEVKDANDRFANMEINTLLQLIERYDGLVILTTNLKTAIDPAFERRLSFKLNFPFPEAATRATIWRQLLPDTAPVAPDLDVDLLGACFELSGGSIKNAVLRAAYRAAALGSQLSMPLFEEAARRECQAAGKLFRVARREDVW
jgi:SpoVK/Ycf46/Vps4 family AAA+-type ATPase